MIRSLTAMLFIVCIIQTSAWSQPDSVVLQGVLTDSTGVNLGGTYAMTVNLYETQDAEAPVFSFTLDAVVISKDLLRAVVNFGDNEPFKDYPSL